MPFSDTKINQPLYFSTSVVHFPALISPLIILGDYFESVYISKNKYYNFINNEKQAFNMERLFGCLIIKVKKSLLTHRNHEPLVLICIVKL